MRGYPQKLLKQTRGAKTSPSSCHDHGANPTQCRDTLLCTLYKMSRGVLSYTFLHKATNRVSSWKIELQQNESVKFV